MHQGAGPGQSRGHRDRTLTREEGDGHIDFLEDVEPILGDVVCMQLTTDFSCGVQPLPEQ